MWLCSTHNQTSKPNQPKARTADPFTALTRHAGSVAFVNETRLHGHSGCSNATRKNAASNPARETAPPGHQPAMNTGGATVRAPAAACTRTPWPNARSMRTDTQPPHLRRAMSPASSHSPPSSVSSTGLVKTPSTRSAPATMAALRITRHTAHCLTGWRHRKQRDARLRPNFVYHRRREQGLSPRPALPTTSPPPTRTGRKCIGPDAERARSCAPQINHTAQR